MAASDPNPPASAQPNQRLLEVGTRVGNYVVERVQALGGFSSIYKVKHVSLQRAAALKVLAPELMGGVPLVRFRQEAEAISRLHHPSIVEVFDIDALPDGRPYLLMEWLEGTPLSEELERRGTFTPAEMLAVLTEVGSALAAVHDAGFVHRDIKPSNIIAIPNSNWFRVKLVDFGLVKFLTPDAPSQTSVTRKGTIVGTPQYMAPEQALMGPIDARTDIYALGVVMYELLSGNRPFESDNVVELVEMHVRAPPPKVSAVAAVPPSLDAIIQRCLAKRPDNRYPTVKALLEDLRQSLSPSKRAASGNNEGVGFSIEIQIKPIGVPTEDELLDELDAALELARIACEGVKLEFALETNSSILAVAMLPEADQEREMLLRRVVLSGLALRTLYAARSGHATRVVARLAIDVGSLVGGQGRFTDGDVLRTGEGIAPFVGEGFVVSTRAVRWVERHFRLEPVTNADLYRVQAPITLG